MAILQNDNNINTNIYKYTASMKYILEDKIIDIDALHIKSIAIDSNYKQMNMPMIFLSAFIHKDYIDLMEENQNSGIIILNIKRATANSDMPDLYTDYIEDKFIYFIASDMSENSDASNNNKDADYDDETREDLNEIVSLGLLSLDHINKNKKLFNGVVTTNLSSLMYYITNHLPILIEPPTNNVEFKDQFLPPMNSVSKALSYINSIAVFYNTPYRFFIDFDCSYLLSSSGKYIKKKGEDIGTVFLTIIDEDDSTGKVQGMTIDEAKSMYKIDIDEGDCKISDNHFSGKSYTKVVAAGTSGKTFNKSLDVELDSNLVSKTKTIRICNDNSGLLDNMVSSLNSSSVQLLVQKTDIDSSVLTMNKEYIIRADDIDGWGKYSGRYLLTRKRELYIRFDEGFTMDVMLLFEKLPD